MTKCFETMDVFLRALYSNVDKSSSSESSESVAVWKFWRHERAELLRLIFSIRQFDKQIWLVMEAGIKMICPLSPTSHILREIYQTAVFVLQTEINFFLKKDLFPFGCSAFLLSGTVYLSYFLKNTSEVMRFIGRFPVQRKIDLQK